MKSNKKFTVHTIIICILMLLWNYIEGAMQQANTTVLASYIPAARGWSSVLTTNPITIGGFISIAYFFLCGFMMSKIGIKKWLVPNLLAQAIASIVLAFSGQNYVLYFIGLCITRLAVPAGMMGSVYLCANWFMRSRGKVLGFVTIGAPLVMATYIGFMTNALTGSLGFTGSFLIVGIFSAVVAIAGWFLLHDKPEDVGLYPDGLDHPLEAEKINPEITTKKLFTTASSWYFVIVFGFLQAVIACVGAYFIVTMMQAGVANFLIWLSLGSILGIPLSFLIGWLDDTIGSMKALLVTDILSVLPIVALLFMKPDAPGLCILFAIGFACMMGGVPTMMPSVVSHIYGRNNYQIANQWLIPITSIPQAFATYFMAAMNDAGNLNGAYIILLIVMAVVIVCTLLMLKIPDAQAEVRGRKKKKAEANS